MTATEYTANALRCLERSQEAHDPQRANLNVAQAAAWASLAQGAQLSRIADSLYLMRLDSKIGPGMAALVPPVCTCGALGGGAHAEDCPCFWHKYTPEDQP